MPLDFVVLFDDDFEAQVISLEQAYVVLIKLFERVKMFQKSKEVVLKKSFCVNERGELIVLNHKKSFNYMILQRFKRNNFLFFQKIENMLSSGEKEIDFEELSKEVHYAVNDMDLEKDEVTKILRESLECNETKLQIIKLFEFYESKIFIKIRLFEFLKVVLAELQAIYDKIEYEVTIKFSRYDKKKEGIIFFNGFSDLLNEICSWSDKNWKISQFWQ